eukprot:TRINITY_DN33538_c0_g1_i1.p2 TRINITY_DN33538_c0_g1~~TRINITY_DN33538_c0_g1_i1.p2  ORF type:complete len:103 (-),score=7.60 TRINITY_DN33538_c0_g1_i1:306-614(-)
MVTAGGKAGCMFSTGMVLVDGSWVETHYAAKPKVDVCVVQSPAGWRCTQYCTTMRWGNANNVTDGGERERSSCTTGMSEMGMICTTRWCATSRAHVVMQEDV